ncbi:uncharacterized protein LOC107398675 [Tribolium castaneum]|nr:PREDICTED: uncharacterized protein LOC107398675 [Tribolium castaneum]|eukprot:XP_015839159.1 PREDICTED: uncharacterized protein LOC107398675 [Tribolium castaneum]
MKFFQMSLLLLSAGLFDSMLGGSNVIPTKEEQANLLTNVQEVFEQVKILVNVEANSTDKSVVCDINKMVERAKDKLELVEELSLTKMSCTNNAVCMLDSKQTIQKLTEEGISALKSCIERGSQDVSTNSLNLMNSTVFATECGQNLLDTLYNCSRKPGLQVISCYKDVIAKDVAPVKRMLLGAIEAHKEGHFRTIEIRNIANDCVDQIMEKYQTRIAKVLGDALRCT